MHSYLSIKSCRFWYLNTDVTLCPDERTSRWWYLWMAELSRGDGGLRWCHHVVHGFSELILWGRAYTKPFVLPCLGWLSQKQNNYLAQYKHFWCIQNNGCLSDRNKSWNELSCIMTLSFVELLYSRIWLIFTHICVIDSVILLFIIVKLLWNNL